MTTLRPITGRHVLIGFLAFFGVIFAVNGGLVYFAIDSWPGLDVEGAYERGLNYNETLDAAERQAKLNWSSRVTVSDGAAQSVRVQIAGGDGNPVSGLKVSADLRRPATEGSDQRLSLNETEPGVYSAAVSLALAGIWRVAIEARAKTGAPYLMSHQVMVTK